eukprot:scaffold202145_cov29-Tisochrysis_lutea.AAC.2
MAVAAAATAVPALMSASSCRMLPSETPSAMPLERKRCASPRVGSSAAPGCARSSRSLASSAHASAALARASTWAMSARSHGSGRYARSRHWPRLLPKTCKAWSGQEVRRTFGAHSASSTTAYRQHSY